MTTTLLCMSAIFPNFSHAAICDVDTDGDVDRQDIRLIIRARNTSAGGPDDPRDVDGDGSITKSDARSCLRQCDLPGCAVINPASRSATEDRVQPEIAGAKSGQNAVKEVSKPSKATSNQSSTDTKGRTTVSSTKWKVARGDTLYAIGRAVYPGNARKQARLRQDIMKLNPSVFAKGTNNMAVGIVLKLPDYVVSNTTLSKAGEPAQIPAPVPDTAAHRPASQPVAPSMVIKPESEAPRDVTSTPKIKEKSEPESQIKKEPSIVKGQSAPSPSDAESNVLVSLGFSYGGDELVNVDHWLDISAGSGGHLRLGYEQMPQHGSGYRLALGLQYNVAFGDKGGASYRDTYLQLAYQYRANQIVYGIGIVSHAGATLKNEDVPTIEYDTANGAVVYLENVGSSNMAGWGLSYTSLELEENNTATSIDASRAELYYNWRF